MPSILNNNRILLAISSAISIFFMQSIGYGWKIEKDIIKIEEGDTLWNISSQLLGDGSRYEEIWKNRLFPKKYKNPNLIFPGMMFQYTGLKKHHKTEDKPVKCLNETTNKFNDIIEKSNVAINNLNLIQSEAKNINYTLQEIEKNIKNNSNKSTDVINKNTDTIGKLVVNLTTILERMDKIIKEIGKINSPESWKKKAGAIAFALFNGSLVLLIGFIFKNLYDRYKERRSGP